MTISDKLLVMAFTILFYAIAHYVFDISPIIAGAIAAATVVGVAAFLIWFFQKFLRET